MKPNNLPNPILYQNSQKSITIIDVPTSIARAQGPNATRCLLSTPSLREPFASTEPKSEKARGNLIKRGSIDRAAEEVYVSLIEDALNEIRTEVRGEWCLERRLLPAVRGWKRKAGEISKEGSGEAKRPGNTKSHDLERSEKGLDKPPDSGAIQGNHDGSKDPPDTNMKVDTFLQGEETLCRILKIIEEGRGGELTVTISAASSQGELDEIALEESELESWDGTFHNEFSYPVQMIIAKEDKKFPLSTTNISFPNKTENASCTFHIPPLSTLILSDCANSSKFRNTFRSLSNGTRTLPLILLDPPWPNTSVKRRAAYSTASALRELRNLLLSMDLDQYIAPNGYVGIWITNNPLVRKLVLGPGGLFEVLNVGLVEEWIWVKTTTSGEPVTPLDGLWRKPYEILLLGRAPGSRMEVAENWGEDEVIRRFIFGVPDLHSRKPCLTFLFERLGMLSEGGKAMEIFARYCIAGWWSWGNEVLKFNWDGYWDDESEERETD